MDTLKGAVQGAKEAVGLGGSKEVGASGVWCPAQTLLATETPTAFWLGLGRSTRRCCDTPPYRGKLLDTPPRILQGTLPGTQVTRLPGGPKGFRPRLRVPNPDTPLPPLPSPLLRRPRQPRNSARQKARRAAWKRRATASCRRRAPTTRVGGWAGGVARLKEGQRGVAAAGVLQSWQARRPPARLPARARARLSASSSRCHLPRVCTCPTFAPVPRLTFPGFYDAQGKLAAAVQRGNERLAEK